MLYVLYVKSGKELEIKKMLQDNKIIAKVPVEEKLIRTKGEWIVKENIIFTGYVFVEINYNAEIYYLIKGLPNVFGILGYDNKPKALSILEAEWIKALTKETLKPSLIKIIADGHIEVVDGVLSLFKNNIKKIDKHKKKATIEITLMNEIKELELSFNIANATEEQAIDDTKDEIKDI